MEERKLAQLMGYYHFLGKDKKQTFFVVQVAFLEIDEKTEDRKCILANVFVTEEEYSVIRAMEIGSDLDVTITPNFSTGKFYYKINI